MKGMYITTTLHGGTVYGFGKEASEATAEGMHPRGLPAAISHTFGLEARAKSNRPPLAGIAMANQTTVGHVGIDDFCLWRFTGGAFRVGPCGGRRIAVQTPSTGGNPVDRKSTRPTPSPSG